MNCPYCNETLGDKGICTKCGKDVSVMIKASKASNSFYNSGLKKAKVHDLSGAVVDLKKSLKLNKHNTKARNLLGLIYYEYGEIVSALSEWVLSKHFQPEDNEIAEQFLDDIQSSPARIENFSQAIKKYNAALTAAKQGNEDLALIQLKKVIGLNPNFLKAMHLMALIYLKNDEYEKAKRILKRARRLDVSNNTTLMYIAEVREHNGSASQAKEVFSETDDTEKNPYDLSKLPINSYREDKPSRMTYINLIIGLVIGLGVTMYLVVPTVKRDAAQKYNVAMLESTDGANATATEVDNLNKTIEGLNKQLEDKDSTIASMNNQMGGIECYDNLMKASRLFITEDKEGAAEAISKVDVSLFTTEDANVLYDYIKDSVYEDVVNDLAEEGRYLCNNKRMEEALVPLLKAYKLTTDNDMVVFFLARSYHKLGDEDSSKTKEYYAKAKKYYDEFIEKFPDNTRIPKAKQYLRDMGFEVTESSDNTDTNNTDTNNTDTNNTDTNNADTNNTDTNNTDSDNNDTGADDNANGESDNN